MRQILRPGGSIRARSWKAPPRRAAALLTALALAPALILVEGAAQAQRTGALSSAMAQAAEKAGETAASAQTGPALFWRLLDAPGLRGVMRLSDDVAADKTRYGFFAFQLRERGVFEGVYNIKPDGRGVIGIFWPDGELNQGAAAGYLDLSAAENGGGAGRVTFSAAAPVEGLTAR